MTSIFNILNQGAKFDKKRFKSDVEIFKLVPAKPELSLDFIDSEIKDLKIFKNTLKIKVQGSDVPDPIQSIPHLLKTFELPSFIESGLKNLQFNTLTPIQMQAIPIIISKRDILGISATGSGKTLAFCLPILHCLKSHQDGGFRALIISPTRELALQIERQVQRLSGSTQFKICILNKVTNLDNVKQYKNFDILISTPSTLVSCLKTSSINLSKIQHIVFDEADKLLDECFLDQIDEILSSCTYPNLQKSLFSATIPSSIETLAHTFMKDPIRVIIGTINSATDLIKQKLLFVGQEEGKIMAIRQLVEQGFKPPCLIFVQSIERARELHKELVYDNIKVDVIHSERSKQERDEVILDFRSGKVWVLISTELMARGIDFKGVNLVVNFDFPQTVVSYIHRIGRCGRNGRHGEAVTFFTRDDSPYLKSVVNVMKQSGCEVPEWMLNLPSVNKNLKKDLKKKPLNRKAVSSDSKYDLIKLKRRREMSMRSRKLSVKK